jgi:hypothetical protein
MRLCRRWVGMRRIKAAETRQKEYKQLHEVQRLQARCACVCVCGGGGARVFRGMLMERWPRGRGRAR